MQPLEGIMITLQAGNALLDREAWPHGFLHRAQSRQGRQVAIGTIRFHGNSLFNPNVCRRPCKNDSKVRVECYSTTKVRLVSASREWFSEHGSLKWAAYLLMKAQHAKTNGNS